MKRRPCKVTENGKIPSREELLGVPEKIERVKLNIPEECLFVLEISTIGRSFR